MATTPETFMTDTDILNLTSEEFDKIKTILGRLPNKLEIELFSLLWSEHASYKNSRKWLNLLPKKASHVIVEAGKESAGVVDIGDGEVAVFKLESHNHPCAVQPRLGASTGARVVNRDIFSMGARPVALLNSLRFGDPSRDTARWLFSEVIRGIIDFEKGFDVPVVGGEVYFNKGFNSSPIVNTMSIGVANKDELMSAVASGDGSLVAVIGVSTGRDGIDGDAFEADKISGSTIKSISADQMRNIEVEKQLHRILKKLISNKLVTGVQSIGAQGIAGALTEMAARGNSGVDFMVEGVPLREKDLSVHEILVSETWGRMLVCFAPENQEMIQALADEHQLSMGVIALVNNSGLFKCLKGSEVLAQFPAKYLGLGEFSPVYERAVAHQRVLPESYSVDELPEPDHYPAVVDKMMKSLNIASKKWLVQQFARNTSKENASADFPSDASIVEINSGKKALLATIDSNPAYFTSDPYNGARIAVAEAVRNIVCAGGRPLAVSDCLNFGNPYDPEAYADFVDSVRGLADACTFFDVPVISGNVSFYNQRSEGGLIKPVIPSPVVGLVGLICNTDRHTTLFFKHKGDMIFLIGRSKDDVNGSEYLHQVHGVDISLAPFFNPDEEKGVNEAISGVIEKELVRSVHDVSNGGLFFSLLESALPLEFGFDITTDAEVRKDAFLFGEAQGRVVVSVSPEKHDDFVDYMVGCEIPFSILGHVTKGEIRVDDESYGFIGEMKKVFEGRLKNWADGKG